MNIYNKKYYTTYVAYNSIYDCGKSKLVSNEHKENLIKNGMLDIVIKHIQLFGI